MRDRFTGQTRRVLDLAMQEADGLGHRFLGPEHVVLGVLRDGTSEGAAVLRGHELELDAARAELRRLAERGVVAAPRPSDAELLGTLGIDLDAIRQRTEQAFGAGAVRQATREATRARRRGIARVPRTPLDGPPLLIGRTLHFAGELADAPGQATVGPELLLLGVLDDITRPWPRCMSNRWRRRLLAHLGLPTSYRGAARPLLESFAVDVDELRDALVARVQGIPR
ncbi:MAG TPA: Clp protease N-terminal domain-containing protein [Actinomycetes bacterium]|nr:Clp protease N-terminal domain-containing protein [Actinomycetes bacterium]